MSVHDGMPGYRWGLREPHACAKEGGPSCPVRTRLGECDETDRLSCFHSQAQKESTPLDATGSGSLQLVVTEQRLAVELRLVVSWKHRCSSLKSMN